MRLGQIKAEGGYLAAVFEQDLARAVPGYTVADLIRRSEAQGVSLAKTAARLASHHPAPHPPALPIVPVEVWACGCTYEMSASFRDLEHGTRDGMQRGIEIGPCIDEAQLETVLRYIEIGRGEAGAPRIGGRQLTGSDFDKGFFVEPTVFADVTPDMTIAREEIFGPVLAVMRARDFEDAMRIANDIPFGLSASLQTTNVSRVFEFVYRMEAGLLTVNLPSAGIEYHLPFGGTKDSSFGPKEQGPAALDFYSDYKTVYLKY